jgi:hypothetical protein
VAEKEQVDAGLCQVVESHYFRNWFSLTAAKGRKQLGDRQVYRPVADVCWNCSHYYPMIEHVRPPQEKGLDVWLSLEAYDLAAHK